MNLPFLPEESILPVFNLIDASSLNIFGENDHRYTKFKSYIENSGLEGHQQTNYLYLVPSKLLLMELKYIMQNLRIWHFIQVLNNIIADTDIDVERLRNGIEISRPIRKKSIENGN